VSPSAKIENKRLLYISFINSSIVILLGKRFGLRVERLGRKYPVRGFNGKLVELTIFARE
jgi:hypothetical protein